MISLDQAIEDVAREFGKQAYDAYMGGANNQWSSISFSAITDTLAIVYGSDNYDYILEKVTTLSIDRFEFLRDSTTSMYDAPYVRVKQYDEDHVDAYARVDRVDFEHQIVMVSNMNMPFLGTFAGKLFNFDEVEFVHRIGEYNETSN